MGLGSSQNKALLGAWIPDYLVDSESTYIHVC